MDLHTQLRHFFSLPVYPDPTSATQGTTLAPLDGYGIGSGPREGSLVAFPCTWEVVLGTLQENPELLHAASHCLPVS